MKTISEATYLVEKRNIFFDKRPIIDQIIDSHGYYFLHFIRMSLSFSINIFFLGLEINAFGPLAPILKIHFLMTNSELELALLAVFLGAAIGSWFSNSLSEFLGRSTTLSLFFSISITCNCLSLLTLNVRLFAFYRFLIGIQLGVTTPIGLADYTEMIPSKYRGFCICICMSSLSFSGIFFCFLIDLMTPKVQVQQLVVILCYALLLKLALVLIMLSMHVTSVRYLIVIGLTEQAKSQLRDDYGYMLSDANFERLTGEVNELNIGKNASIDGLVNSEYLRSTCLLAFIWFATSINSAGPVITFADTILSKNNGTYEKNGDTANLANFLIFSLCTVSCLLGGILCEWSFLGRKKTLVVSFGVSALLCLTSFIGNKSFEIVFPLSFFFNNLALVVLYVYTAEIYATTVRTKALGLLMLAGRLGGVLANYVFVELKQQQKWSPYLLYLSLCCLSLACSFFLQHETKNLGLDQLWEIEKEETDNNNFV